MGTAAITPSHFRKRFIMMNARLFCGAKIIINGTRAPMERQFFYIFVENRRQLSALTLLRPTESYFFEGKTSQVSVCVA